MVTSVILDTDILVDHARGRRETLKKLLRLQEKGKIEIIVPSVVIFEFYSGSSLENKNIFDQAEILFSQFRIVSVDELIAKLAAEINRKNNLYQEIGAVDLLVGATAIYYSGLVATRNKKDFQKIPGIEFWKG